MKPRPRLDPEQILTIADESFRPSKRFVLFSGGNDSATLLHWVWNNAPFFIDAAVHVNTGIGVPQTRDFVRRFCDDLGVPLIEQHAPEGEYERLCREYGMPGPGAHQQAYTFLKDRQFEALVREHGEPKKKGERVRPVMLISGPRRDESTRRGFNTKPLDLRKSRQLWVAPFVDWTNADLSAYREAHDVPRSEVADVLHMSGECLCGAYGSRAELIHLKIFYPEVVAQIERCEQIAKDAGQKYCLWGERRDRADFEQLSEEAAFACQCAFGYFLVEAGAADGGETR